MRSPSLPRIGLSILVAVLLIPTPSAATVCRQVVTGYIRGEPIESCSLGDCAGQQRCTSVDCEATRGCPGNLDTPAAPVIPTGETIEERVEFQQVLPRLQIPIPGFPKFSDIQARRVGGGKEVVSIPWIGEYLAAIYRWAVPVGAVLATVVIMVAGLIWLTSGGAGQLSTAKEWIGNAVIGLILLVGSYVVLNLINPDLVRFSALQVEVTQRVAIASAEEEEPETVTGQAPTPDGIVPAEGTNIIGNSLIDQTLLAPLQTAARALQPQGYQIAVTSSYRTVADQERLIRQNCQNQPGSQTCNPKSGRPQTCILRRGPESCPHTTGRAIDAWGARSGRQCLSQAQCIKDKQACRANPCQAALIQVMRKAEFCNLLSEPWHFEKPKMSRSCT